MNNSIRKQLVFYIILFTAVFLLFSGALNYWLAKGVVSDLSEEKAVIMTDEAAAELQSYLLSKGQYAWMISQNEQVHEFVESLETRYQDVSEDKNYSQIHKTFRRIVNNDPDITEAYIAIEKTQRIYDIEEFDNPPDYFVNSRPWYQAAKEKNSLAFSSPYICPVTGRYVITASCPFYDDNGDLLGVAAVDILAAKMQYVVTAVSFMEYGYAFLLDEQGTIIAHPDKEYLDKSMLDSEEFSESDSVLAKNMMNGQTGALIVDEGKHYVYYEPIPEVGWSLGLSLPVEDVVGPVNKLFDTGIMIGVLCMVIIWILVTRLTDRVIKPLDDFIYIMTSVSDGDYNVRASVNENGTEVDRLGQSLNKMLDKHKRLVEQIISISYQMGIAGHELTIVFGEIKGVLPVIHTNLNNFTDEAEFDQQVHTQEVFNKSLQDFMEKLIYFNHNSRQISAQINELLPVEEMNDANIVALDEYKADILSKWSEMEHQINMINKYVEHLQIEISDIIDELGESSRESANKAKALQAMQGQINSIVAIGSESLETANNNSMELITLSRNLMQLAASFNIIEDNPSDCR